MKDIRNSHDITTANWIWLVISVVVSVLFIVFSTPIYEMLYYNSEFSNEMYNSNMYYVIALCTVLIVWFLPILYYLVIDSNSLASAGIWSLLFVITLFCAPAVTFFYSNSKLTAENLVLTEPCRNFALANIGVTAVLFLLVSYALKHFSQNCECEPISI
jgi:magnesium-transporting ATPase (P-type)